ncbi:MAG: hypothetical protein AAF513_03815 [Pseudomonadota bacterium]
MKKNRSYISEVEVGQLNAAPGGTVVEVPAPADNGISKDAPTVVVEVNVIPSQSQPWLFEVQNGREGGSEVSANIHFDFVESETSDPVLVACQRAIVIYTMPPRALEDDGVTWRFANPGILMEQDVAHEQYRMTHVASKDGSQLRVTIDQVSGEPSPSFPSVEFRLVAIRYRFKSKKPSRAKVYVSQDPLIGVGRSKH